MSVLNFRKLTSILSGNFIVVASTFIVASILVSKAGLAEYGKFITNQAILLAMAILFKPSTWVAVVRYRDKLNLGTLAFLSISVELAFSICSALFFYVSSIFYKFEFFEFIYSNFIVVFLYVFVINSGCFLGVFRATERYFFISMLIGLGALLKIGLAALLYYDVNLLLIYCVAFDIALWFLASVYSLYSVRSRSYLTDVDFSSLKEFLRVSMTSSISQILDLPLTQLDRVIIAAIAGDAAAGIFNLLRRLSALFNQLGEPLYQVYYRYFSSNDFSLLNFNYSETIAISLRKIGLPIFVCLIFYPLVINYVDMYFFNSNLNGYYLTLFLFLLTSSFSVIFVWINPLYYIHVSEYRTIYVTFVSNLTYVSSIFVVFYYFKVELSFVCIMIQLALSYYMKFFGVTNKIYLIKKNITRDFAP